MGKEKLPITKIDSSEDVPSNLAIKDGRLICKDGSKVDFSKWPDVDVNLIATEHLKVIIDEAFIARKL